MIGRTFLHYIAVVSGLELPQTQTSNAERALLHKCVRGRKTIVEIGVFEGFTTRLLVEGSDDDATVFGVDPFFVGRLGVSWGLKIASAHNRAHLKSGRLKLIRTLSTEVGNAVPDAVDFVFIDGDHSLSGIRADWDFWSRRTKPDGVIALHDTILPEGKPASSELGSHRYFRNTIRHDRRFEIVHQIDSLSVLKKIRTSEPS